VSENGDVTAKYGGERVLVFPPELSGLRFGLYCLTFTYGDCYL